MMLYQYIIYTIPDRDFWQPFFIETIHILYAKLVDF